MNNSGKDKVEKTFTDANDDNRYLLILLPEGMHNHIFYRHVK